MWEKVVGVFVDILDSEINHPPLKKEGEIIEANFLTHNTFFLKTLVYQKW